MYHLLEKLLSFKALAHIFATQIRNIFVYFMGITYHNGMHTVGLCKWMLLVPTTSLSVYELVRSRNNRK